MKAAAVALHLLAAHGLLGCGSSTPERLARVPSEPAVRSSHVQKPVAPAVTAVTSVPPLPPAAKPPLVMDAIGTRAPTAVVAASPAGDWVVLCQAREDNDGDGKLAVNIVNHGETEGDRLRQYYVERGGTGTEVDAFVGHDPTGRFLAFLREGHLILRDTHAQLETDLSVLGADARDDLASYAPHRAGSFAPDGTRFLYLRRAEDRSLVVVRSLATAAETLVSAGSGTLWRAAFEPDGFFIRIQVVLRDTTGDKKMRWPVREANAAAPTCPLPVPQFVVAGLEPDRLATSLYRLSDDKILERSDFVLTLGPSILTRDEKEALWLEPVTGTRRQVAPPECHGRVLHAHAETQSVLVGCAGEYGQRRGLYLSTPEKRIRLGYEVAAFESDGRYPYDPRFLVLNPGNESILLDMVTGSITKLPSGTSLIGGGGGSSSSLLVTRQNRLLWLDGTGMERDLGLRRPPFARVLQSGSFLTLGRLWFDMTNSAVAPATLPSEPTALARTGRVLLYDSPHTATSTLPLGPVEWHSPLESAR